MRQNRTEPAGAENRSAEAELFAEILSRLEEGDGSVKIRVGGRAVLTLGLELL